MTTGTTNADYTVARDKLGGAISSNLEDAEKRDLPTHPKEVADDLRGGYVRDAALLTALFTPAVHAEYVEGYEASGNDVAEDAFLDFCIQELNEQIAYLALVAWPNAIGRDYAWGALSFPLKNQWSDKVAFLEKKEN